MCESCWEHYFAGYFTKSEVYRCPYYLDIFRNQRDTHRRIPKRDPDDPRFCLSLGEGIYPFFMSRRDEKDWHELVYLPTWRRRVHRLKASGVGADAPEERAARGVEDETNWVAEISLNEY